jgi:hypothetical protein
MICVIEDCKQCRLAVPQARGVDPGDSRIHASYEEETDNSNTRFDALLERKVEKCATISRRAHLKR